MITDNPLLAFNEPHIWEGLSVDDKLEVLRDVIDIHYQKLRLIVNNKENNQVEIKGKNSHRMEAKSK